MSDLTLAQRVQGIERALGGVPHAFGGALALAYCAEPRATIDIDVNVFVPPERMSEVLAPLRALGVDTEAPGLEALIADQGQARVFWDDTPIDLFFGYDPVHGAMEKAIREVPFGDGTIHVLAPEHLIISKVVFNRPKDWVDIDAILATGATLDAAEVLRWVARIAGDDDPRFERVAALLSGPRPNSKRSGPRVDASPRHQAKPALRVEVGSVR